MSRRLWRAALIRKPRALGETSDAGYWDVEPRDPPRSFRPPAHDRQGVRCLDEPDELLRKLRIRVLRQDGPATIRFLESRAVFAALRKGISSRQDRAAWGSVALSILLDEMIPGDRRSMVSRLQAAMSSLLGVHPDVDWHRRMLLLYQRRGEPYQALEVVNVNLLHPAAEDFAAVSVASARAARAPPAPFLTPGEVDEAMRRKNVPHSSASQTAQLSLAAAAASAQRHASSWEDIQARIDSFNDETLQLDRIAVQSAVCALACTPAASGSRVADQLGKLMSQVPGLPPSAISLRPLLEAFDSPVEALVFLKNIPTSFSWCADTGTHALAAAKSIGGEWRAWALDQAKERAAEQPHRLEGRWAEFYRAAASLNGGTVSAEDIAAAWRLGDSPFHARRRQPANAHRGLKSRSLLNYKRRPEPRAIEPPTAAQLLQADLQSLSKGGD